MNSILAALVVTAIVAIVPQANAAPTVKVMVAGSSAQWQSMALAAYNGGNCVTGGTAPCFHYTGSSNFNLNDTRPTLKGGSALNDPNAIWIVWDSSANTNVWAYIKVDSVVGLRCYFAHPHCNVNVATFPAPGNKIGAALWGDNSSDSTPPSSIQTIFTAATGPFVTAAATDIRPEDGLFAACRANSKLGGGSDGLAGLGYNTNNASGACPTTNKLANLVGADIKSGYPNSTATAHVVAFNISGKDPFSGNVVGTYTTVSVGASPIVFITARSGALAPVKNATDAQVQTVFSGKNCDASAFGAAAGAINAYLREPLSGTMNTTEASVFRYPNVTGTSQETGVNAGNPLAAPCTAGGSRYRGIGTGEVVSWVLNSNTNTGRDGIAYAFFSYGNVASIANNSAYGYVTLNGVDPIFHQYGSTIDPGQPSTPGVLPAAANLPASCSGSFPCPEGNIWSGHLSFPNLRNGSYRAWSVLRVVSSGINLANLRVLVLGEQNFAVNSTPDFVPAVKVGNSDPGLPLLRSHYTQEGVAPVNIATSGGDKGGDMGGCILSSSGAVNTSDTTTKLAQAAPDTGCVSVP
jgi:hypothetical protein